MGQEGGLIGICKLFCVTETHTILQSNKMPIKKSKMKVCAYMYGVLSKID